MNMESEKAPLLDHLNELRKRLTYSLIATLLTTVICFNYYEPIAQFFIYPFQSMLPQGSSLNVNSIYEGFLIKLKLSFIAGTILALPFSLFQLCWFLFPGLKSNEKKWTLIILVCSSLFSIVSCYMGYAIIFPYIIEFLTTSQFIPTNINILLNLNQNISYIISFLFAGILIFQTPIILEFMLAKNIVSRSFLLKNARWFIVGIVITSAMITPPDIISQLSLSIPLIICYFGCILFAKIMRWGT